MNRGSSTERSSSTKVLSSNTNGASSGGTIRSVPSDSSHRLDLTPVKSSDSTSSRNGNGNMPISRGHSPIPTHTHPPPSSLAVRQSPSPSVGRSISTEFGHSKAYPGGHFPLAEDTAAPNQQWSSAVGRANLGKSGRVIERLMGENDMLKRDIHIERLRAEESKQELKMAEAKTEQMVNDYEAKLHDAVINKTLLKRRERQLADLKSQVDGEKSRADRAQEAERGWREMCEQAKEESMHKIDEATTYAALLEGRNKTLSSHWKEQGAEIDRAMNKMRKEIAAINAARKEDDNRMNMLQSLCDQQAKQVEILRKEKDDIATAFEKYQHIQEELLADIKAKARKQEAENEAKLEENRVVLGELRWAIGVKKNLRDAQ
ncbi:hypothetical protein BP5796_11817 [Coleophoma crateriformis]|uniref:SWI5-dependent HO expression protein 3 n=1 Tax=Coleophoma crateriformis TaxID=565419 RepID=A0A3D8QET0_9HELO|nr:hypothetical protein BP5796_11817 [Coleophoma crateriformis]